MTDPIRFFVPGHPRPGGSKRAFNHHRTGKVVVVEDCKGTKLWRQKVKAAAQRAVPEPLDGPLAMSLTFILPRPRGHFGTGRNHDKVKASAPEYPVVKPDSTKLTRSTEDAMVGVTWRDDSQIVAQHVYKIYGETPGCWVEIAPYDSTDARKDGRA